MPFEAGSLVLASLCRKPGDETGDHTTDSSLWFKKLLIGNGVVCVLSLLFCAFLAPDSPQMLTLALLFIGGLSRSMQFTGISSLAFASAVQ